MKVTLTDYTWKDYFDTMVLRFRGSTPTQVMYCGEDWLPGWALAGWLVPIEDKFPEIAKYKDKIANYAVRDMTYNGKLYGLPYYADLITFQYNAKILADHGIAMPQDWDQVLDACLKLKQAGMEKPFVYEYDQTLPNFYQAFVSQVYGRGGRMFDDNLEPLFNDPNSEAFKHLQWLQDAVTKHEIVAFESHETRVIPAMNTGKHAFSVLFNYVLAAMNEKATQPLAGQFAMGLMPGSAHACLGFCKFYAMTSQAAADPARSRGELEIHRVQWRRRLPGRQALGGGERPRLCAAATVRRSRCAEGLVGLDRCRDVQDPGPPRRQRHPDRVARHVERIFPTADGQGLRRRGQRGRGHGRWRETLARAAEARPRGVTGGTDRRAARASAGPGRPPTTMRDERYAVLWVLPALLLVLLFTLYPVADALYRSLHQVIVILPTAPFVGLANYREVVTGHDFWEAVRNTAAFAAVTAPLAVLAGFGAARLLLTPFRGRALVRAVVILPWVLPGAISAVIWTWVFHPSWGTLNLFLYETGLIERYIPWLTNPQLARLSVAVAFVWTQFPFAAIMLMSALIMIDRDLYDAARVDGAGIAQRFRYVTFPNIRPMVVVLLTYHALVALTSYDLVYAMTAGGPGTATTLLSFRIWQESFSMMNFGTGSAIAFLLVLLSLAFMVAILRALPTQLLPGR